MENSSEENPNNKYKENIVSSDENHNSKIEKNKTRIGNKFYDEDTMNRITIVRLTQVGVELSKIRKMLKISRSLLSKWVNYAKSQ